MGIIALLIAWILQIIALLVEFSLDYIWHPNLSNLGWLLPTLGGLLLLGVLLGKGPNSVWTKAGMIVTLVVFGLWNSWLFLLIDPAMKWERQAFKLETTQGPFLVTVIESNVFDPVPFFYIHKPVKYFPILYKEVFFDWASVDSVWEEREAFLLKSESDTLSIKIEELPE